MLLEMGDVHRGVAHRQTSFCSLWLSWEAVEWGQAAMSWPEVEECRFCCCFLMAQPLAVEQVLLLPAQLQTCRR